MGAWKINTTYIDDWLNQLNDHDFDIVLAALEFLSEQGPGCGRPFVDKLHYSRHPVMKELRPRSGNIRIIFAFDPQRTGIMLLGGDKTNKWNDWYKKVIPIADDLYDQHLRSLESEIRLPTSKKRKF